MLWGTYMILRELHGIPPLAHLGRGSWLYQPPPQKNLRTMGPGQFWPNTAAPSELHLGGSNGTGSTLHPPMCGRHLPENPQHEPGVYM